MTRDLVTPEEDAEAQERRRSVEEAREKGKKARRGRLNTTDKGKRGERRAVEFLRDVLGFRSRRQPRSGSIEGLPHDVVSDLGSGSYEFGTEVKWFAKSRWRTLDKLRDGADALALYRDQEGVGQLAPEGEWFLKESALRALIRAAYDKGFKDGRSA